MTENDQGIPGVPSDDGTDNQTPTDDLGNDTLTADNEGGSNGDDTRTPEEVAEEAAYHKYQSWQGRREKEFEERIVGRISDVLNTANVPAPQPTPAVDNTLGEAPDPELDLDRYLDWRDRKKEIATQNIQFQNDQLYQSALNQVKDADPEVHKAVMNEIDNLTHSGDPIADARINYQNAQIKVLRKQLVPNTPTGDNPLRDNPVPGAGLGSSRPGSGGGASPAAMPQNLDAASRKLIAHTGWGAEKVREVLGTK